MPINFQVAKFALSVLDPHAVPPSAGEVAFSGRSNAGKSSVINVLCRQTRLAYVSKTPGRTQCLNFFDLGRQRYLVDLPGYGFADVPPEVREQWDHLLTTYLQTRRELAGIVVIMDARHPLTPLDVQMLDWLAPTGKPVHVVLTKADKLGRQAQTQTLAKVTAALAGQAHVSVQLFSSPKRIGIDELQHVLDGWLR